MMIRALHPNDGHRDVERAIDELGERLPLPLLPLARLAYNYRWSWIPGGAQLFHDLDPAHWRRSACNPRYVIEATVPRRFHELARDEAYVARVRAMAEYV